MDGGTGGLSHARRAVADFWSRATSCNLTGLAAMVAYTMLIGVVPMALLALFITGRVLSSPSAQRSVLGDMRQLFPGATEHTLNSLLHEIMRSTTSTGVLALLGSLWLGASFWGSLDTSFAAIYGVRPRPWLEQKRFGLAMVGIVLLFLIATVAVPTIQSILRSGASHLPFGLARVTDVVYLLSLLAGLFVLFGSLTVIYARVPNRHMRWRAVWPGALGATLAIGVVDYAFPAYLSNISTIARFGTTVVFVLIVLAWFYTIAVIVLGGAIVNAMRLGGTGTAPPSQEAPVASD